MRLKSEGITRPYWFSLDGINFQQNEGVFDSIAFDSKELVITNSYDTLTEEFCLNTFSEVNAESCTSFISPSKMFEWTISGTYSDTLTNSIGCDSLVTVYLELDNCALGAKKKNLINSLYPNPSSNGKLNIELVEKHQILDIAVYNQTGQIVLYQKLKDNNQFKIQIRQPEGLYLLKLIDEYGTVEKIKFVVK